MEKQKQVCDLCKRKLGNKTYGWCLIFYNLKNLTVCEECEMSINEQIVQNLDYFWNTKNKNGGKNGKKKSKSA